MCDAPERFPTVTILLTGLLTTNEEIFSESLPVSETEGSRVLQEL